MNVRYSVTKIFCLSTPSIEALYSVTNSGLCTSLHFPTSASIRNTNISILRSNNIFMIKPLGHYNSFFADNFLQRTKTFLLLIKKEHYRACYSPSWVYTFIFQILQSVKITEAVVTIQTKIRYSNTTQWFCDNIISYSEYFRMTRNQFCYGALLKNEIIRDATASFTFRLPLKGIICLSIHTYFYSEKNIHLIVFESYKSQNFQESAGRIHHHYGRHTQEPSTNHRLQQKTHKQQRRLGNGSIGTFQERMKQTTIVEIRRNATHQ